LVVSRSAEDTSTLCSRLIGKFIAHAVLDVVVNDEVKFFFRKAIVLRKDFVDFVDDGF